MADNTRNAGRKPRLTKEQIVEVRLRRDKGESVKKLFEKFGVSRQTMSAYLNRQEKDDSEIQIYTAYHKRQNCIFSGKWMLFSSMRTDIQIT